MHAAVPEFVVEGRDDGKRALRRRKARQAAGDVRIGPPEIADLLRQGRGEDREPVGLVELDALGLDALPPRGPAFDEGRDDLCEGAIVAELACERHHPVIEGVQRRRGWW